MLNKVREQKGCFGIKSSYIHNINREIFFSSCIGNYFDQSSVNWLSISNKFDSGQMPFSGTILEQPAKLIDVMNLIKNHKAEILEEQQKRAELRSGNRGR